MPTPQSELDDFMGTIAEPEAQPQVEQAPTPVEQPVQPIVQSQQEEPAQEPLVTGEGTPVEVASTPEPVAGGKTPEQVEIERLRSELNRRNVDHEVSTFENNLRLTTEKYLENKNASIEKAHQRNRELIDSGEPEKADQELRAFYARVEAADNNMRNYVQSQRQEFVQQREHIQLAPMYAQHLGKVHKLAPEDVALLSKFEGSVQDRMIPDIVARNKAAKSNEARLRDLEAASRAQSGAFAPAGSSGGAVPAPNPRPSDPTEAELWDYMQSPVMNAGGR